MRKLSKLGRIFFGIAIAVLGVMAIYYRNFPYMLIPEKHSWIAALRSVAMITGFLLFVAGVSIVFEKMIRSVALVLGSILLLIFLFYFIPYEFIVSPDYMHFGDWENAAKELALCGGALTIANCYSSAGGSDFIQLLGRLAPFGVTIFSMTIISFGVDHFLFAKEAADYVPSRVPFHLFWMYFTGSALLCSGLAVLLNIRRRLAATLLGTMIITWFIILHMPRVISSPAEELGSEITSASIALAYSGIAFVIGGSNKKSGEKRF